MAAFRRYSCHHLSIVCRGLASFGLGTKLHVVEDVMSQQHTHFALSHLVSGLHIFPSPIIPSARWLKGARSPLAPTVPCSGIYGRQEAFSASTSCCSVSKRTPLNAFARTLILRAITRLVCSGESGDPTPAE